MSIQKLCPVLHLDIVLLLNCKDSLYILDKRIRYMACQHSLHSVACPFMCLPGVQAVLISRKALREFLLSGILIPWQYSRRHSSQKAF